MTRKEQIEEAYQDFLGSDGRLQSNSWFAFKAGAEWADQNIKEISHSIEEAYQDYLDSVGMIQATQWSAFKAGVKWVDENKKEIWHDASEEPQENEYVLIQDDENDYDVTLTQSTDEWDTWCGTCKIIRWAYIDDLIPKGGNV